ncbi:MAG: acyloxyacyl hydrolase [Flavobacteriales bacterium]|nr:acyloxyacyl hydrolase [Flavobacteriales bacterium]
MSRSVVFLFLLVCQSVLAIAQELPKMAVGMNYYPGFLVAHRVDAQNLEAHIHGFQLQISKQQSVQPWASVYNKPKICMGFLYMDLGRPELTGKAFAAMPGFETSLTNRTKSNLRMRFSTGLAYLTKKFDVYTNRHNLAIGSHVNGVMQGLLLWEHQYNNLPLQSHVGIGLTHFSNGSFRIPNLGVNMPSLTFGLHYLIDQSNEQNPIVDTLKPNKWQVHFAYGFKEQSLTNTTGFHIFNIEAVRIKRINIKRGWRFGTDFYRDRTYHFDPASVDNSQKLGLFEQLECGLFAGHQLLISRVYFITDFGAYLYKPTSSKYGIYQRIGFNYHFNQKGYAVLALKTHFGIADHFTWGLGYKF